MHGAAGFHARGPSFSMHGTAEFHAGMTADPMHGAADLPGGGSTGIPAGPSLPRAGGRTLDFCPLDGVDPDVLCVFASCQEGALMSGGAVPGNEGSRPVREEIGAWLRERREFLGLSQEDLRRRLARRGIQATQSTLSRWESGSTAPPADTLAILASVLGDSLSSLEDRVSAALARTGEMVDVSGRTVRELVDEADRAAHAGNFPRVLALLEAARDRATLEERAGGEELAALYLRLAAAHLKLWHLGPARDALRRLARMKDVPRRVRFQALLLRLQLADREEDPEGFRAWKDRVERELADDDLPGGDLRCRGWQLLGGMFLLRGDLEQAVLLLERSVAGWQEIDNHLERLRTTQMLAFCRGMLGDTRAGARELLALEEEARTRSYRELEAGAMHLRGRLLVLRGEPAKAVGILEDAASLARLAGLAELEFAALYEAWQAVRGAGNAAAEERLRRRLLRLLPGVHPRLPEAVRFREEAGTTGDDGDDEEDQP